MTEPEPLPPAADPYPDSPPIAPAPAAQDYPSSPVAAPAAPYGYGYGYPPPPPPRKKSKALKIVLISLAAVFALCVSGSLATFLWVRNTAAQPAGAVSPDKAAEDFLTAYYRAQDPVRAKKTVCAEARDDKKIAAEIAAIKEYAGAYEKPTFTWSTPKISNRTPDKATVTVDLTVTTDDLKAAKKQLTLDAVHDKGWWICAVRQE
jgi:hypothetical protein